jgi:hypothetical protein
MIDKIRNKGQTSTNTTGQSESSLASNESVTGNEHIMASDK